MKITHAGLKDAFVLEVDLGDVPVWEVDYGEVQLYPDTATGVKRAKFRAPEYGSEDWCRFIHSLNMARRECSDKCNIVLRVAGREYSLFGSVNGLPAAQMSNEGYVTFPDGHVPSLQELGDGASAALYVTIPQAKSASIGGNQAGYAGMERANELNGCYVTGVYSPVIKGSEVRGYFTKGQKKVSTGERIVVTAADGATLINSHKQQNGHKRGYSDWSWGEFDRSVISATMTVIPHMARGPWGGYFIYPEVKGGFVLPLEGIVFCQEDDDKFDN